MKKILLVLTLAFASLLSGCVVYPVGFGYGHGGYHHYDGGGYRGGGGWRR